MIDTLTLFLANDNRLLGEGLATKLVSTGVLTYLDATATVQVTLVDLGTQATIAGETWPLALSYITGTNGNFHGVLRDTLTLTELQQVEALVTIDNGADQRASLALPCLVQRRRS